MDNNKKSLFERNLEYQERKANQDIIDKIKFENKLAVVKLHKEKFGVCKHLFVAEYPESNRSTQQDMICAVCKD